MIDFNKLNMKDGSMDQLRTNPLINEARSIHDQDGVYIQVTPKNYDEETLHKIENSFIDLLQEYRFNLNELDYCIS